MNHFDHHRVHEITVETLLDVRGSKPNFRKRQRPDGASRFQVRDGEMGCREIGFVQVRVPRW